MAPAADKSYKFQDMNVGVRHVLTGGGMLIAAMFAVWGFISPLQESINAAEIHLTQMDEKLASHATRLERVEDRNAVMNRSFAIRETKQDNILTDVDEIKKELKSLRGDLEASSSETQQKVDRVLDILMRGRANQ